ncbi:hypothetical protein EV360DRAFT_86678 [Lentinula raphanica]|nr:hypothetical protein EV360DRAFT_86678 [Lentinula raphanica]
MHPFGGTPKCPRCQKAVYLAEQVIGPGRKLYHKPCLACTICNKRLDSLSLLEHDEEPYCKSCHIKNFGTRDLRQANHPYRARSPSLSPGKTANGAPQTSFLVSSPMTRLASSGTGTGSTPLMHLDRAISPTSPTRNGKSLATLDEIDKEEHIISEGEPTNPTVRVQDKRSSNPAGIAQIVGGDDIAAAAAIDKFQGTIGRVHATRPLTQNPTGTRYGAALGGGGVMPQSTGNQWKWGGNTPSCPKCGKSVYFAEQVKAVGKTYHKGCLRCSECGTSLDSTKLRDHEGVPFCSRCYNKLHGPQGNGYALLGKAGG